MDFARIGQDGLRSLGASSTGSYSRGPRECDSTPRNPSGPEPALANLLTALQNDPDPRVRFQLLCTLGFVQGTEAQNLREQLLLHDLESEWTHLAALSASPGQELALFQWAIANLSSKIDQGGGPFIKNLSALIGRRAEDKQLNTFLSQLTQLPTNLRVVALQGLAKGVPSKTKGISDRHKEKLLRWSLEEESGLRTASLQLLRKVGLPDARNEKPKAQVEQLALGLIENRTTDETMWADAVHLLTISEVDDLQEICRAATAKHAGGLCSKPPLRGLARIDGSENASFLLERWEQLTPAVRATVVSSFRPFPARMHLFLSAVEEGSIAAQGIGPKQVFEILKNDDKSVRRRATKLFEQKEGDRAGGSS